MGNKETKIPDESSGSDEGWQDFPGFLTSFFYEIIQDYSKQACTIEQGLQS